MNQERIKKVVYTFVVADLFHYGHLQLLQTAKSLGDYHICGVLTDNAAQTYRPKPITNIDERIAVLSSINCIDKVIIQDSKDPTENLKKIHSEYKAAKLILVHGNNWSDMPGKEYINKIGGEIVQPEYYKRLSDTKIAEELSGSNIPYYEFFNEHFKIDNIIYHGSLNKTFSISTKANTLKALQPLLKKSKIEKSYIFRVQDWLESPDTILHKIQEEFKNKIVIRSSTINEDTFYSSKAGYYYSENGVPSDNKIRIKDTINKVIKSYEKDKHYNYQNQVLVQSQTENVKISGVVLTKKVDTGSPYYVINYDDESKETDKVTGGVINKIIEIINFSEPRHCPVRWQKLISAVKEIEKIIPNVPLDIEFAVNTNEKIIIYQVRPLIINNEATRIDQKRFKGILNDLKMRFNESIKSVPHLIGETNCFSDMAFWNPAEIIGDRPNYLDYSLYAYLITDETWHKSLASLGYKNVNPANLMINFAGKPYIDMRMTFNSLLPEDLNDGVGKKIISYCLNMIKNKPQLHDKIEFEIVSTCFDFNLYKRLNKMLRSGFNKDDINQYRRALIKLTNNILTNYDNFIEKDLNSIALMEKKRKTIQENIKDDCNPIKLIKYTFNLLDDCKKYGTLPFARIARMAFVGKSLLLSMVTEKFITNELHDSFMDSLNTIAKTMSIDCALFNNNRMSKNDFLNKYGHLRPGTYDITSYRYDKTHELFNQVQSLNSTWKTEKGRFRIGKDIRDNINEVLKKYNIEITSDNLFDFIKNSFELRELLKFEFTKNLSDAIEFIALMGEELGFPREEMAYMDLESLRVAQHYGKKNTKCHFKKIIKQRKSERIAFQNVSLPPVIYSENDFEVIRYHNSKPNYITRKCVQGKIAKLNGNQSDTALDLFGKIVLIEKADPGYDWIFTKNIAGLVTRFGGIASHMAIRCAEFGLPAVIGCGEVIYANLLKAHNVYFNCDRKEIKALN